MKRKSNKFDRADEMSWVEVSIIPALSFQPSIPMKKEMKCVYKCTHVVTA